MSARFITISLRGREARIFDSARRAELLAHCVRDICKRKSWRPYDLVLLPAGVLKVPGSLGGLPEPHRLEALDDTPAGGLGVALAQRLDRSSPGCLLVAGVDTPNRRPWRGDLMVATFSADGPTAVTRMVYPVRGDRNLVYPTDADTPGRVISLASGRRAWVCVCYDAFALAELASGELGRRGNIGLIAGGNGQGRAARPGEAVDLLKRLRRQFQRAKPDLAVVAIHRFARPGRELLWQRHGLATASAALGGRLVIAAAHFTDALPETLRQSPLAARGVGRDHLGLGGHRPAREYPPVDGFYVTLPGSAGPQALVRLFQAD